MCEWICGKFLPKDIDTPPALFVSGAATAVVVKMEVDSGASMFEKSMSTFALHNEMFSVRNLYNAVPSIRTQVELDRIVPHTA